MLQNNEINQTKEESKAPGNHGILVLIATILGSAMVFIDGSVVNIALPVIQQDFKATTADVQWVVESYMLFLSALILVGGALGDLYGRKKVFAVGIAFFTVASITCGFAQTTTELIISRAVQGIGGALLTPGSLAIITASFDGKTRGKAIGTWSGFSAITTAFGPVLGGWLIAVSSWRSIFFINIPLAIVVLIVLWIGVPESKSEGSTQKLDWLGAFLATVGLGALVYALVESSNLGTTSPTFLGTLALGILGLICFIIVEARSDHPMMPLKLFASRIFSGTNMLTLFLYGALSASLFFLPFNLIQVQHYSIPAAGAVSLPFVIIMFALSRWSGGLITKYGARLPLVIGPLIAGAGFVAFALLGTGGSYWTTFFPAFILLGVGMAITVAPLTTAVMSSAGGEFAGVASGINNAVARTAGLLSIAVLGIVAVAVFQASLDSHLALLSISPSLQHFLDAQSIKLAGVEIPSNLDSITHQQVQQAINDAFFTCYRAVMQICAGLAVLSAFSAGVLITSGRKDR